MNIKVFNIRLSKEHCQEDQNRMNQFLDSVEIKLTSTNFVTTSTVDFWSAVVFFEPKKETKTTMVERELTDDEKKIYAALKKWRSDKAQQLMLPHYMICHNSELASIAVQKPQTLRDFKNVKGFGENKTDNYGDDIISLLNAL
ncbi:MAG: HRDC domain-containing protein [Flavobacterium sp.]|nr:HRDC domain-containing protein [Flavobacterium sp.]MBP7470646.1 HRDC domain-containing protein [Flavobacterium sp.]